MRTDWSLLGAAALMLGGIAPAPARGMTVALCSGGVVRLPLPDGSPPPRRDDDCALACHAATRAGRDGEDAKGDN